MKIMTPTNKEGGSKVLVILAVISFILTIGSSWYQYSYKKNYDYLVEAACDPTIENCFFRDCEASPDDCPPNQLSYYKEYLVKAYDFPSCTDGTCLEQCMSGSIQCKENLCSETEGAICSADL